jgi:hypothetical protein
MALPGCNWVPGPCRSSGSSGLCEEKSNRMLSTKQGAFIGRVEAVLSHERLRRYAVSASEPRWESVARYAWNVALCEAFYPLLHGLEVVLRNRLNDLGRNAFPYQRFQHIPAWMDADPSPLHQHGRRDVLKAKQKLFGTDRATGALLPSVRPLKEGDLVAALDLGFWTGLFGKHYLYQSSGDKRLWPHGFPSVFPYAPATPKLGVVSWRINELRHLRNRVFHHEPIWRRPDLAGDRDSILGLLDWMSPEAARLLRATERLTEVLSNDFRRRLRARIYLETRR